MKLYFYRGERPNFGDELNHWMWPKLIKGVWDEYDGSIFLGIGSILFDHFPKEQQKIVFGAGFGGYTQPPKIDENWKIYFVRGKQTAKALGIDESFGVGDAAILLRSLVNIKSEKTHKISFMPHWGSAIVGNWELACQYAGINYIDPCAPVDKVLEEILASELVITEAMHGAIVADALRVPWVAAKPLSEKHVMKWYDWASPLDIDLKQHEIISSSLLELLYIHYHESNPLRAYKLRTKYKFLGRLIKERFAQKAAESLLLIGKVEPTLSSDIAIENAHEKMVSNLHVLIKDLGFGKIIC